MKRTSIADGFFGRTQFWLCHNLQKRSSGSIQINAGMAGNNAMYRLAGIFFKMCTRQIDCLHVRFTGLWFDWERQLTTEYDWQFKLTDLIPLRQIWIKIIFAIKNRMISNLGPNSEAESNSSLNRTVVQHRQCTGER